MKKQLSIPGVIHEDLITNKKSSDNIKYKDVLILEKKFSLKKKN